jgi:hypothetical protein
LCHDIEKGLGHIGVDPHFAAAADETSLRHLDEMLGIEREMGIKATYNVVGCLFNEVRERIERDGHCIAFHSYNHNTHENQLEQCRQVDYRVKGYRPPQSKITPELRDENLCYHNFEWLANSAYSLGLRYPVMRSRIVKIPILFDDFELYRSKLEYRKWEQEAIDKITQNDFVAFSLHDCYAKFWLPHYRSFLKKIGEIGKLQTLNEISSDMILSNCR